MYVFHSESWVQVEILTTLIAEQLSLHVQHTPSKRADWVKAEIVLLRLIRKDFCYFKTWGLISNHIPTDESNNREMGNRVDWRPLYRLFSIFFNQKYNAENIQPSIRQDLKSQSLNYESPPLPKDQCSRPYS